ncbi:MAG: MmcQ/YjbR family DNA-binding protein, partial [Acidobacteriota bacterium]
PTPHHVDREIIRPMPKKSLEALEKALRDFAMTYPETHEDHPWGHSAIKVRGKAFVFLGGEKNTKELSLSVKLPQSRDMASDLPFAEPTGYGLGKSGWVTARFTKVGEVPIPLLEKWIDESYRAIAPKKLVKTLPGS